jgi:hypothetical protein
VSNQTARVIYATANGTAKTSNNDYVASSGAVTFSPGQTSKTITVTIKGDKKQESDEQFYVNLFGASGAQIDDGQGVGTILNDDSGSSSARQGRHPSSDAAVDAALDDLLSDWLYKRRR